MHREVDDDLKEYRLDHYDDDEEDANGDEKVQGASMGMFGNAKSLAYYENNDDDPYITLKKVVTSLIRAAVSSSSLTTVALAG